MTVEEARSVDTLVVGTAGAPASGWTAFPFGSTLEEIMKKQLVC